MNYLIDTCILIDFLRGKPCVYAALSRDKRVKLSMSTITMMELGRGTMIFGERPQKSNFPP